MQDILSCPVFFYNSSHETINLKLILGISLKLNMKTKCFFDVLT